MAVTGVLGVLGWLARADLRLAAVAVLAIASVAGVWLVHRQRARQDRAAHIDRVAHELRGPLTAVVATLDALRDSSVSLTAAEREELQELASRAAAEMTSVLDGLLIVARRGRGIGAPQCEAIDLVTLTSRCVAQMPEVARRAFVGNSRAATAWGDPNYVRQIVANLVQNADRYAPAGAVEVSFEVDDERVILDFSDDGPGIVADQREAVFDEAASQTSRGGLGLGLAHARELARLMGGDLRCVVPKRAGATFRLVLPRAVGADGAKPEGVPRAALSPRALLLADMTEALVGRSLDLTITGLRRLLTDLLRVEAALLLTRDADGTWRPAGSFEELKESDVGEPGVLEEVARTGRPEFSPDLAERYPGWANALGSGAALFLPASDGEEEADVLGVLVVGWRSQDQLPSAQGLMVAEAVAQLAGIALDRTNLARTASVERRLRSAVMDALPIAVSVFAGDPPVLIDANQQERAMLGMPDREASPELEQRQRHFDVRFADGSALTVDNAPVSAAIRTGERAGPFLLRVRRQDGSEIVTRTHCAPFDFPGRDGLGAVVTSEVVPSDDPREAVGPSAVASVAERHLGYERALAECARVLLMTGDVARIEDALDALRQVTRATSVFVERNVDVPGLGLCTETLVDVTAEAFVENRAYWTCVPWSSMPTSRVQLERGRAFAFRPDQLDEPERSLYAGSPERIEKELDIPIFVGGTWRGLIGFTTDDPGRVWTAEELTVLEAVATMIAAFWEREDVFRELELLLASKDELIAGVSHALRTPLTAVLGYAHVLSDDVAAFSHAELEDVIGVIRSESLELAHVLEDLLVAARGDISGLALRFEPVDVEAEVAQLIAELPAETAARVSCLGAPPPVIADALRFRQIVRNLLTNAAAYGGERIEVRFASRHEGALIDVADDGMGLSAEVGDALFEPYRRGHDDDGQPAPVGMGLTVARRLARRMGGSVNYLRDGEWSVFRLELPLSPNGHGPADPTSAPPLQTTPATEKGQR